MYINFSPFILVVFDIHVYQFFSIYTCSNIKYYKYNWWNIDMNEYQTRQVYLVKHWYTWISNTTSINSETLIYMNIKHYKYNWWNIDCLIFMYINFSPFILVVFDIHVYQFFSIYTCSVWYSCISMFHQLYL
jgi:hypothetical protein